MNILQASLLRRDLIYITATTTMQILIVIILLLEHDHKHIQHFKSIINLESELEKTNRTANI